MFSIQKFIAFICKDAFKKILMRYRTFKIHQIELPFNSSLLTPENISIGKNFSISPFCHLVCQDPENGSKLVIGNRVALNYGVIINADCGGKITIGDDVLIGPNTIIRAANHVFGDPLVPIRSQGHQAGHVKIEDNVWIGAGVIIVPNVIIGHSSVVGAGSVVTKDIPPFSVALGNPAKVSKKRN